MKGPVMSAFQGFRRTKYIHTYSLFKVSSHWGCNEIHLLITSIQSCLWHQLPRVLVGSLGARQFLPTTAKVHELAGIKIAGWLVTSTSLQVQRNIFYCQAKASSMHTAVQCCSAYVHPRASLWICTSWQHTEWCSLQPKGFCSKLDFYCHYGLPKFFAPVPIRSFLKSSELKELISNIEKDIIFQLLSNFLLVSYVSVP